MENQKKLLERIEIDPCKLGGKPVIKGTRIAVEFLLKALAQKMSIKEICTAYDVEENDVLAAITYAEKIVEQEYVLL